MVIHSVVLKFKETANRKEFLEAAYKLDKIDGVQKFEILEENHFDYSFSMEFEN